VVQSIDPNDDYLVALASSERAVLVSGDGHLTVLADRLPVRTPAEFLAALEEPRT
jgi:predicted nucleic acid-binding protein